MRFMRQPGTAFHKEMIIKKAYELGYDDVIPVQTADHRAVLLLISAYGLPEGAPEAGTIRLSNYYIASQQGYLAMRQLLGYCAEIGVKTQEYREHGIKGLAAAAGGSIGKNTLYYHPEFGSYVCIHAIEVPGAMAPEKSALPARIARECASCRRCETACPSGAIGNGGFAVHQCIRAFMMQKEIPVEYGRQIDQLMGCERCQAVCPRNPKRVMPPVVFPLKELLRGEHTGEIRKLIGVNYGRRRMIFNQAVFYAANAGYADAIPEIAALLEEEQCKAAAVYALEKLGGIDGTEKKR